MIHYDWHAAGRMRMLVVDGGLEFRGTSLEMACNTTGITIVATPRRTPWAKGKIERFLGTLNRARSEGVPGTNFRSIEERGDYDSSKQACVTLSTLKANAMQWIADIYHQTVHTETRRTPSEMWVSSIQPEDIYYPDDFTQLDAVLGSAHQRTLSHSGIEFKGISYNSAELENLRRMEGPQLTVDIRVDESNLGHIHVLWPKTSAVFRVPALDQRYASGLSLFAHKVNRREQRGRADLDQGQAGRSQAQQEILKRIEEDRRRKKLTNRAQRYLEGTPAKEEDAKLRQQSAPTNTPNPRTPSSPARIPLLKECGRPKSASSLVEAHEDDDLPTFIATRKDHPNAG